MSKPLKSANWSLEDLPGLGHTDRDKLSTIGITTTFQLLRQTRTKPEQTALSGRSGIHLRHLQKWTAIAQLARIPAVGCQFSGLLLHTGIATIPQLALSNAGQLHRQILRLQVATIQRPDLCPDASQIEVWIQQAKLLVKTEKC
jgi:Domain of unknown function (DUF4332)